MNVSGHPPAAIVLAAGLGQRLGGRVKASLQINGTSLMERLAQVLREAGVGPISAVIGPYRAQWLPLLARSGVSAIEPADCATLIASQTAALHAHIAQHPGRDLMLLLSDLPLLTAADVRRLLAAWPQRPTTAQALAPVVGGVRGHPLLLSWPAVQAIAASPSTLGIRAWLQAQPGVLHAVHSTTPGYIQDLDTPQDLEALRLQWPSVTVTWPEG